MRRVGDESALYGWRVYGVPRLKGEDLDFGFEARGDGREVGGAGVGVAGLGAMGVQFEVANESG